MSTHAQPSTKFYLSIFGILAIMTVVTVLVSYLQLPKTLGIFVGLVIATFKASLVATFFMHLKWERPLIYGLLGMTAVAVFILFIIPSTDSRHLQHRRTHSAASAPAHAGGEH